MLSALWLHKYLEHLRLKKRTQSYSSTSVLSAKVSSLSTTLDATNTTTVAEAEAVPTHLGWASCTRSCRCGRSPRWGT
jgi:hypothetical protein